RPSGPAPPVRTPRRSPRRVVPTLDGRPAHPRWQRRPIRPWQYPSLSSTRHGTPLRSHEHEHEHEPRDEVSVTLRRRWRRQENCTQIDHEVDVVEQDYFYTVNTPCVYYSCMSKVRTNIEIEDTYVKAIMDR